MPVPNFVNNTNTQGTTAKKKSGVPNFVNQQPVPTAQPAPTKVATEKPSILAEAPRGLIKGIKQFAPLGHGVLSLGASAVGADKYAEEQAQKYTEGMEEIEKEMPSTVQSYKDIKGVEDAARYGLEAVGTLAPDIAATILSGGAAGLIKFGGKEVIKKSIKQGVGAAVPGLLKESTSISGDIYKETGEVKPGISIAGGAAAGAVDAITGYGLLRKITGDAVAKEVSDALLKRVGIEGAKNFFKEGGTEAIQTGIESGAIVVGGGKAKGLDEYIDSFLKGGIGGGVIGGGVEAIVGRNEQRQELVQEATEFNEVNQELGLADGDTVSPKITQSIMNEEKIVGPIENVMQTPEQLRYRYEQLQKFGMTNAMLRQIGRTGKNVAGYFQRPQTNKDLKQGLTRLSNKIDSKSQQFLTVLAHELGHNMEWAVTGAIERNTFDLFKKDLDPVTRGKLREELKAVTIDIIGEENYNKKVAYYGSKTELMARFLQSMFDGSNRLDKLAPTAKAMFNQNRTLVPEIDLYLKAVEGTIDSKQQKHGLYMKDLRQIYNARFGQTAGEQIFNKEISHRAMQARAVSEMTKLVEQKFRGVKDPPQLLFRVAEAVLKTVDGMPIFGTRDLVYFDTSKRDKKSLKELAALEKDGFVLDPNGSKKVDRKSGKVLDMFARTRYTKEQGEAMFNRLSPEGQQLIKDYTAIKSEARDFMNREAIKGAYGISSDIEGYVHHWWDREDNSKPIVGRRLKQIRATSEFARESLATGYVEDLQKSILKVMVDLESSRTYNSFIKDWFARISKPLADGEKPEPGWVDVSGDILKEGISSSERTRLLIMTDKGTVPVKKQRYQIPVELRDKYDKLVEAEKEAGATAQILQRLNRYWQVNILIHPGSVGTNVIGGALQLSAKFTENFYTDLIKAGTDGDFTMYKTRALVWAMITTLTPKGWAATPDWMYGGDLSNHYGQFVKDDGTISSKVDKGIDFYADKGLKLFGGVERYFKKVIAASEKGIDMDTGQPMTVEGLRKLNFEEQEMLVKMMREADIFAFDYDNIPPMLEAFRNHPVGAGVKPFLTYPYKYYKFIERYTAQLFDRNITHQERLVRILTLGTFIGLYAALTSGSDEETPELPSGSPTSLMKNGRLFIGKNDRGNEQFVRVAKYPILNMLEAGRQLGKGNLNESWGIVNEMFSTLGPTGKMFAETMGLRTKYDTYKDPEDVFAEAIAGYVPLTRILTDVAKMQDPNQRVRQEWWQAFTSQVPIPWATEEERAMMRGKKKTIDVPLEGGILRKPGESRQKKTTEQEVLQYSDNALLAFLTGIYITEIDPDVAKAFEIRAQENAEKKKKD